MAYCSNCGKEILNRSKFCRYCGASQHETAQAPDPEEQAAREEVDSMIDSIFGKAIAGAACSYLAPIVIVGVVLSCRVLKRWEEAAALAKSKGIKLSKKGKAVRVLGLVGKIYGIVGFVSSVVSIVLLVLWMELIFELGGF